jgi:hypothetical protein
LPWILKLVGDLALAEALGLGEILYLLTPVLQTSVIAALRLV